jgi:exodeoxyribonuclease-5
VAEFKFTPDQTFALEQLSGFEDYYNLKGYAGTGKTTVITHWVQQMRKRPEDSSPFWRAPKIVLTAPTNKATGVLKNKAQELELPVDVSTIHSLLSLKMKWEEDKQVLVKDDRGEDNFSIYDYVVIDECSMIDEELLRYICRAQKESGNKVIFMGDPCQLPPINEKGSRTFNVPENTELTTIVRQGDGNPIVDLSMYLRDLILADHKGYPNKLFDFVDGDNILYKPLADNQDEILEAFAHAEGDIRHVAWTNKVVDSWNDKIRDRIYGFDREDWVEGEQIVTTAPVIDHFEEGILFSTDTLLEIDDTPERYVEHGVDCWQIHVTKTRQPLYVVAKEGTKAFRLEKERLLSEAKADRKKWRKFYEFMEFWAAIKPAHSLTVHRSQGSTFDDVYVSFGNILANPRKREALQCLYVAVTRPSKRLILV